MTKPSRSRHRQVDGCRSHRVPRRAEHDVAHAVAEVVVAVAIGAGRADEQVVDTVAVDVAGAADREPGIVLRKNATHDEAVGAGQAIQIHVAPGAQADATEHDVCGAGIERNAAERRTDEQVVDAVAVDVAGAAHRPAGLAGGDRCVDDEAVVAVQ